MLTLVQSHEIDQHSYLIDQMHRLRARAFGDRLCWQVKVVDGRERDEFDDANPLYVISLNGAGDVVGSLRLLQTTGPTMLAGVFSALLEGGQTVRSPLVWESTRFCVDTSLAESDPCLGINRITSELVCGALEIGLLAGLTHIVTVVDVRMERILRRTGCVMERLVPPKRIGDVLTLAVLVDCSEESLMHTVAYNSLQLPIVKPADAKRMGIAA